MLGMDQPRLNLFQAVDSLAIYRIRLTWIPEKCPVGSRNSY
jgi:hypothetical protein